MNKSNWIKTLAIACFVVWLVALSLVNLLDKRNPTKLMTVETRWSNLAAAQKKLEGQTKSLDSARQLVSIYAQQNMFSQAESLAEKILHLAGENSLIDLETLANVERQKGDYKKSIQTLETIARLEKSDEAKSARNQINLGTLHYLNGLSLEKTEDRKSSFQKAKDCFNIAEKLIPTGEKLISTGSIESAEQSAEQFAEQSAELIALKENKKLNDRELKKITSANL